MKVQGSSVDETNDGLEMKRIDQGKQQSHAKVKHPFTRLGQLFGIWPANPKVSNKKIQKHSRESNKGPTLQTTDEKTTAKTVTSETNVVDKVLKAFQDGVSSVVSFFVNQGLGIHKEDSQKPQKEVLPHTNHESKDFFWGNKSFNTKHKDGITLLHIACEYGDAPAVDYLLQEGLDINAQDNYGRSPLHYACIHRQTHIIQLLLAKPGIKPDILDHLNHKPSYGCSMTIRKMFDTKNIETKTFAE